MNLLFKNEKGKDTFLIQSECAVLHVFLYLLLLYTWQKAANAHLTWACRGHHLIAINNGETFLERGCRRLSKSMHGCCTYLEVGEADLLELEPLLGDGLRRYGLR